MVNEYDNFLEKFFQKRRFAKIVPYVKKGRVLDFGSRDERLKSFLTRGYKYQGCERDYSVIKGKYDTIVISAVLEYIPLKDVDKVFSMLVDHLKEDGVIIMVTINILSKPTLKLLVWTGRVDKLEDAHEHVWSKKELFDLAKKFNMNIIHHAYANFFGHRVLVFKKIKQ